LGFGDDRADGGKAVPPQLDVVDQAGQQGPVSDVVDLQHIVAGEIEHDITVLDCTIDVPSH
jgi:hypothetical protein